jgi:peptidoglycan hydrolase-like protein with peptidoglycan-binding domain
MTVANTFASKALVAVVAAAMIFSAFVTPAKAATAEELQKMINDLMAQMAALQGGSTTGSSAAGVCPYTWTRDLKTGATGADVQMELQKFFNANRRYTCSSYRCRISRNGNFTTFGPATAAAVSKFQVNVPF